jgi:hypothetical protein
MYRGYEHSQHYYTELALAPLKYHLAMGKYQMVEIPLSPTYGTDTQMVNGLHEEFRKLTIQIIKASRYFIVNPTTVVRIKLLRVVFIAENIDLFSYRQLKELLLECMSYIEQQILNIKRYQ